MILSKFGWCLSFCMMAFFWGCQGVENLENQDFQSSSQLHGVYDEQYFLRLAKSPDAKGFYRFETCLASEGSVQEASCVGALADAMGKDITFTENSLDQLALTEEEKKRLKVVHGEWKDYRQALRSKGVGDTMATIFSISALATLGIVVAGESMVWDPSSRSITKEREKIAEFYTNSANQNKKKLKWEEVFGQADHQEALKQLESMEADLKVFGYSLDRPPESVLLAKAERIRVANLRYSETGRYLISDKFYAHLEDSFSLALERNGREIKDVIFRPDNLAETLKGATWRDAIDSFIQQGGSVEEVINPRHLDDFFKYNEIENHFRYYDDAGSVTSMDELTRALMGSDKEIISILDNASSFVVYEGVPRYARWKWEDFVSAKKTYLAGMGGDVSSSAVKNSVAESLSKIKQVRATKTMINAGAKSAVATSVLIIGAVTAGIIAFSRRGLQGAKNDMAVLQDRTDQLQQLFLDPSSLMSEDFAVSVAYMQDTVKTLSLWQKNFGVETQQVVSAYCLPTETADGLFVAECYNVES